MAKGKEIANGTGRRTEKDSKIKVKGQIPSNKGKDKKNSKSRNTSSAKGNGIDKNEKPEVITVTDSENDDRDEEVVKDEGSDDKEEEANTSRDGNKVENGGGKEKDEVTKKKNGKRKSDSEDSSLCFPMNRITRIMKNDDADIRITQESAFLVNKATEKFLELFCKEAYSCALLDSKNHVSYKHLSSVVSKQKGFDFLLDIVPDKMKAEDALALAET